MTRDEAMAEAKRRWASAGTVQERKNPVRFVVGTIGAFPGYDAIGYGDSWESAFADADRRAREGK